MSKQRLTSAPLFKLTADTECSIVEVPESAVITGFGIDGLYLWMYFLVNEEDFTGKPLTKYWHFHIVRSGAIIDPATDIFVCAISLPPTILQERIRMFGDGYSVLHLITTTQQHETPDEIENLEPYQEPKETPDDKKPESQKNDIGLADLGLGEVSLSFLDTLQMKDSDEN